MVTASLLFEFVARSCRQGDGLNYLTAGGAAVATTTAVDNARETERAPHTPDYEVLLEHILLSC